MSQILQAKNVTKTFGDATKGLFTAIKRADLTVEKGEFVSLLGPSGCGKSTLLDILAGLETASDGDVIVEGNRLSGPHPKMAMVFQQHALFPWRTALANVEFGLVLQGVGAKERRSKAIEMIRLVGLEDFSEKYPAQMSGGMNQRLAIARALALDPDILLMDEPFGALDEQTRRLMGMELLRIQERTQKTIIFVTHSIQEAIQLSDRILLMSMRPSVIREEIRVPIARPRTIECLTSNEAKEIERRIWSVLMEEVGAAPIISH